MTTIQELDLIFDVTSSISAERFDDNSIHGTKSTMKRVDFIIEEAEKIIFFEVKDPDMPGAANPDSFRQDLHGGKLIADLAGKFRDSLLFTRLRGGYDKPIHYVVLICMATLDDALVISKTDALRSAIPMSNSQWNCDCAVSCIILKLDAYKEYFGEESVWRASEFQ